VQSCSLAGPRSPTQIDGEVFGVQDLVHGPLLLLSQPLRGMEFPFTAQSLKQSNTPIHYRNHALFAFKAFACSQVVSRSNERTLRLFHFQSPAQLTRINLPATKGKASAINS
jgi:hypothetical protein